MREVRMTFGEHLEELRKRIFFSLLWLGLAVALSLVYGKSLLKWTIGPHEIAIRGAIRDHSISVLEAKGRQLNALAEDPSAAFDPSTRVEPSPAPAAVWDRLFSLEVRLARLEKRLESVVREFAPRWAPAAQAADFSPLARALAGAFAEVLDQETFPVSARSLPERFRLLEEDLRRSALHVRATPVKRLLGVGRSMEDAIGPLAQFNQFLAARKKALEEAPEGVLAGGPGSEDLVRKLERIYLDMETRARAIAEDIAKQPIALSYLESFMTYFKVAMIFGLFFSTPLLLYEMWKFVGAGLYPHEQRYVLIFMPFSVALFFGGALFGYFSVIPVALEFLAGWGTDLVELNFSLANYVGLFFTLTILLGLVFQTPLVMVFLGKIGLVGPAGFRKARKWAVLGAVVFAAIVTPPDPLSWSLVAGPMILLYELGILIVAFSSGKKIQSPSEARA